MIDSDCGLTEAASNLTQPVITTQVFPMPDGNNYLMSYTPAMDKQELKKYLAKDFRRINIFESKQGLLLYGIKRSHGIMGAMVKHGNIPVFPAFAYNRKETFYFLTETRKRSEATIEDISKNNYVYNVDFRSINNQEVFGMASNLSNFYLLSKLTEVDIRVLKEALEHGYYNWPRNEDLSKISNSLKLSKPTVLYHLRNSERKIINSLFHNRKSS